MLLSTSAVVVSTTTVLTGAVVVDGDDDDNVSAALKSPCFCRHRIEELSMAIAKTHKLSGY